MTEPKISVATAVGVLRRTPRARAIADAMQLAIEKAAEEGITAADRPDEVKARIMKARQEVIDTYAALAKPTE